MLSHCLLKLLLNIKGFGFDIFGGDGVGVFGRDIKGHAAQKVQGVQGGAGADDAALGIAAMKKRHQTIYLGATNIPLLNADIVTGISMMLLFVKFIDLGFVTVLLAHITFSIPYVILNVLPKMKQTNRSTYEAALDLGATPLYAFYKVTWPEIRPGVFSGFMMAVTMSLDDFSITYFTKGAGVNTLSTMLYTELRKGIKPELYALSTILFFAVLLILLAGNVYPGKKRVAAK
mgnify:CR=1 FL=1